METNNKSETPEIVTILDGAERKISNVKRPYKRRLPKPTNPAGAGATVSAVVNQASNKGPVISSVHNSSLLFPGRLPNTKGQTSTDLQANLGTPSQNSHPSIERQTSTHPKTGGSATQAPASIDPSTPLQDRSTWLRCLLCQGTKVSPTLLKQHLSSGHFSRDLSQVLGLVPGGAIPPCPECGRAFTTRQNLICHFGAKHNRILDVVPPHVKEQLMGLDRQGRRRSGVAGSR